MLSTPRRVADIRPGSFGSSPRYLTAVGNTLYFVANDGSRGYELWKSDGTSGGTRRVADVNPGSADSNPRFLTAIGNILYFQANDGSSGVELWRSDGTDGGTSRVADLNPGGISSNPDNFRALGDTLFFRASDGSSGFELWRSDGTSGGTSRVADLRPGVSGSNPSFLTPLGTTLYFQAADASTGFELWKSDGTSAGTSRVADIFPGGNGSFPKYFTAIGNTLYFQADDGSSGDELWRSDGTGAGTSRVADIFPGSSGSFPSYLTAVGNTLYFQANDGSSGYELWRTDGNTTSRVADINPGSSGSNPTYLTAVGNRLFFSASDGSSGRELWTSDGTSAGTRRVADIRPGPDSSYPFGLTVVGDTLFFRANDGSSGDELWALDVGTAPPAPSLSLLRDTGSSSSDRITSNRTIVVSDLEAGAAWQFSTNSGRTWTTGVGTSFLVSPGRYTTGQVRVRQTDPGGNTSPANSSFAAFSVDRTAPNLRFNTAGVRNRINGTSAGRLVSGAGADPNRRVDLLVKGRTIAQTKSNPRGGFSFALSPADIQRIGQGRRTLQLSQTDLAGNTGRTARKVTVNTTTATAQRDMLTGNIKTSDVFTLSRLQDSLLSQYDTITNLERVDRLLITATSYRSSLRRLSGVPILRLNAREINNTLGGKRFNANAAAAFQVDGINGTFVALNDNRAGFQANSDAIVLLEGYNIGRTNPVSVL